MFNNSKFDDLMFSPLDRTIPTWLSLVLLKSFHRSLTLYIVFSVEFCGNGEENWNFFFLSNPQNTHIRRNKNEEHKLFYTQTTKIKRDEEVSSCSRFCFFFIYFFPLYCISVSKLESIILSSCWFLIASDRFTAAHFFILLFNGIFCVCVEWKKNLVNCFMV